MATTTDIVPISTRASQVRPQYSIIDERLIQQYQQSKYQPWTADTSETPFVSKSSINETASGSCKKHMTTKLAMSIFIGLVIFGIPLAVISTLYALKKASPNTNTNTNSGNTGSSDNSSSLPSQCSTYITNTDSTRLATFTSCVGCFYDTSPYFTTGWYRFVDPAGTRLATTPPSTGSCGASYPAWYNGTYPSTSGSTISSTACVHMPGTLCTPSYLISISITDCNSYYVFYLPSAIISSIRYCTTF